MQSKAIEVIRHSLAAASAALNLLETEPVQQTTTVVEEAAPVVEEPAFCGHHLRFATLMVELNGRYALRTVAELEDKLGMSFTTMTQLLEAESVGYITRTRRSDSAPLIGLASRN